MSHLKQIVETSQHHQSLDVNSLSDPVSEELLRISEEVKILCKEYGEI